MKIALSAVTLALAGCSVYAPDAGHEVVLVDKPWFFGHGGVESAPVKTGRTWAAITTEGVDVYMQPQKFDTELPDTMTSDGVPITFHAIVVLQVIDSAVAHQVVWPRLVPEQYGGAVQDDGAPGGTPNAE